MDILSKHRYADTDNMTIDDTLLFGTESHAEKYLETFKYVVDDLIPDVHSVDMD